MPTFVDTLTGMKTKTDRCESLHGSDLILLILDTTGMEDMAAIIASYAAAFNSTVRAKQKVILFILTCFTWRFCC